MARGTPRSATPSLARLGAGVGGAVRICGLAWPLGALATVGRCQCPVQLRSVAAWS